MKFIRHTALHEYNSNFKHVGYRSTLSEDVWGHWNMLDSKSRMAKYGTVELRLSYMYNSYDWDYCNYYNLNGWGLDYFQPPEKDSYKELLAIKGAIVTKKIVEIEEVSYKIFTMGTLLGYFSFHQQSFFLLSEFSLIYFSVVIFADLPGF
jgi:hypothetical protein